jgi:N-acyl-D-aspartate/D-glutamate deacylase
VIDAALPDRYVIRGADVVDGTGSAAFAADVVVDGDRLHRAPPGSTVGMHVLDADGLTVVPGFIDVHSHADLEAILWSGNSQVHHSRLHQGVTTEVVGNCGFSPFPVPPRMAEEAARFLGVVFGAGAPTFPAFGEFAAAAESAGLACNVAPLVGHGTLRVGALGYQARRANDDELVSMSAALRGSMREGAFGLSSGLCYTPATFADAAEPRTLAGVLADTGGIYASHVRNETDLVIDALAEAVMAVSGTVVPIHISHVKAAGRDNWGRAGEIIDLFEAARMNGVDVTADAYPYAAASTMLHSLLPPWMAEGGIAALLARLTDRSALGRAADDVIGGVPGWQNLGRAAGWDKVVVASSPAWPKAEGRSIAQLATAGDSGPVDTIARLLIVCAGEVVVVIDAMSDTDVAELLAWPHILIGSDGIPVPGKPHPRLTGTFPRVLGRYRESMGSFEDSVHRMTGRSAARFSIPSRGIIDSGSVADLVLLDPSTVMDRGTYVSPWEPPTGIHRVLLAGRAVVWDGEVVDDSAGRVLKRPG